MVTTKAAVMVISRRGIGGWGQGGGGVRDACDYPNHLGVGGNVCSLTNNCVAHKV